MNISGLTEIIEEEQLTGYNLDMDGKLYPDELVLFKMNDMWATGITSERAGIMEMTIRQFDSEEAACDDFLERLRILNRIKHRNRLKG